MHYQCISKYFTEKNKQKMHHIIKKLSQATLKAGHSGAASAKKVLLAQQLW